MNITIDDAIATYAITVIRDRRTFARVRLGCCLMDDCLVIWQCCQTGLVAEVGITSLRPMKRRASVFVCEYAWTCIGRTISWENIGTMAPVEARGTMAAEQIRHLICSRRTIRHDFAIVLERPEP